MSSAYVVLPCGPITMPSSTRSCAAGAPSFSAARSTSTRRASAAARRIRRAPFDTPVLPDAPPWLHDVPVSPMSTATLSKPTSSSSATIWATATSRPCPMSILPRKACTLPFGSTAIQESSSPGASAGLPALCASTSNDGAAKETTSAPEVLRNSRRSMSASLRHAALRALDGAQDRDVRAAAAFQPRERIAQFGVGRLGVLLERGGRRHYPAVDAVAALRHAFGDIRRLQRMRLLGRAEARDSRHLLVRGRRNGQYAGAHRLAVELHRAGAALREPATEVRIVQAKIAAQSVEQRHLGLRVHRNALAVDGEPVRGHASPPQDISRTILPLPCGASAAAYAACASSSAKRCVTCGRSRPLTAHWNKRSSRSRVACTWGFSTRTPLGGATGGMGAAERATNTPPRLSALRERTCAWPPSVSSTTSNGPASAKSSVR